MTNDFTVRLKMKGHDSIRVWQFKCLTPFKVRSLIRNWCSHQHHDCYWMIFHRVTHEIVDKGKYIQD